MKRIPNLTLLFLLYGPVLSSYVEPPEWCSQ